MKTNEKTTKTFKAIILCIIIPLIGVCSSNLLINCGVDNNTNLLIWTGIILTCLTEWYPFILFDKYKKKDKGDKKITSITLKGKHILFIVSIFIFLYGWCNSYLAMRYGYSNDKVLLTWAGGLLAIVTFVPGIHLLAVSLGIYDRDINNEISKMNNEKNKV